MVISGKQAYGRGFSLEFFWGLFKGFWFFFVMRFLGIQHHGASAMISGHLAMQPAMKRRVTIAPSPRERRNDNTTATEHAKSWIQYSLLRE
ncbi:hypothetical protein CC80DRAFT_179839 [Byssothecium circinans]|uniref:Uncharacterized protein n=1 Tax=Byssothecium circinans TaxID=147558 RepID=A0A6A5TL00_9PLEO|nr:hypothetical protein CC80DRAFT_179839 [Byssothecium circinans]